MLEQLHTFTAAVYTLELSSVSMLEMEGNNDSFGYIATNALLNLHLSWYLSNLFIASSDYILPFIFISNFIICVSVDKIVNYNLTYYDKSKSNV